MTFRELNNLVRIGQLKSEPFDQNEFDGLLASAKRRLQDASVQELSEEGRFISAYNAAHAASVAALRWHGYRSSQRYQVFQCLGHTLNLDDTTIRVLIHCHQQRNLAEYEGYLEFSQKLMDELMQLAADLITRVEDLRGTR